MKPVLGDYPQVQLKPELHQDDETGVDETVRGWMDANIFEETGIWKVTCRVYMKIVDLMTEKQGTYENLYNAFSRSIQDWTGEFNAPQEQRQRGINENLIMDLMIRSLGLTWKRESRDDARRCIPEAVETVFTLLPQMSVYEWKVLVYLLGPSELTKRGPSEIFGTLMPDWTPEMVLTNQVIFAGCTKTTDCLIQVTGGDFQKYPSALKRR